MTWEVLLCVPPELEEILTDLLQEAGSTAVSVEDAGAVPLLEAGGRFERCRLRGYFEEDVDHLVVDRQLRLRLSSLEVGVLPETIQWRELLDEDWQEAWKRFSSPMPVGERLLVLPSWIDPPLDNQRAILRIDPEMAFGSGSHETTSGCLAALERFADHTPLETVLDLGTGSGILAIGAALLGAKKVLATDNDPIAVETCRKNSELNGVAAQITPLLLDHVPTGSFQVVVANILAQPLIDLAPGIAGALPPGGGLILSGLLANQADMVCAVYRPLGFTALSIHQSGEWAILTALKDG